LLGSGTHHSTVHRGRGDGSVHDVVNLVGLEREDLRGVQSVTVVSLRCYNCFAIVSQ
jgi:hypothetical protein